VKRILSIVLIVAFLLVSFGIGSACADDAQGSTAGEATNVTTRMGSYSEFIATLAKSRGTSVLAATLYYASVTRNFEKMHPELFGSASAESLTTGHYEYPYYSHTTFCWYSYCGCPIYITQTVAATVYIGLFQTIRIDIATNH